MKVTVKLYNPETGKVGTFCHEKIDEVRDHLNFTELIHSDWNISYFYEKAQIVFMIENHKEKLDDGPNDKKKTRKNADKIVVVGRGRKPPAGFRPPSPRFSIKSTKEK